MELRSAIRALRTSTGIHSKRPLSPNAGTAGLRLDAIEQAGREAEAMLTNDRFLTGEKRLGMPGSPTVRIGGFLNTFLL